VIANEEWSIVPSVRHADHTRRVQQAPLIIAWTCSMQGKGKRRVVQEGRASLAAHPSIAGLRSISRHIQGLSSESSGRMLDRGQGSSVKRSGEATRISSRKDLPFVVTEHSWLAGRSSFDLSANHGSAQVWLTTLEAWMVEGTHECFSFDGSEAP
jgi:hypothetical protein